MRNFKKPYYVSDKKIVTLERQPKLESKIPVKFDFKTQEKKPVPVTEKKLTISTEKKFESMNLLYGINRKQTLENKRESVLK